MFKQHKDVLRFSAYLAVAFVISSGLILSSSYQTNLSLDSYSLDAISLHHPLLYHNKQRVLGLTTATFQQGANGYSGTQDSYITTGYQNEYLNNNYGSLTNIDAIGSYTTTNLLIKFDLSSIPAGSTISSATLSLYDYSDSLNNQNPTLTAYKLNPNWQQGSVTCAKYDGANAWNAPCAGGGGIDYNSNPAGSQQVTQGLHGWYNWSLDAATVQSWVSNPSTNNGLKIVPTTTMYDPVHFYSSEYSGNASLRPKLTVTYDSGATGGDVTPPVISNIGYSGISSSAATINWVTDEASDSQVDYGTSVSYGSSSALNSSLTTSHSVNLSGLTAATTYHYRVKSRDAAGNLQTSSDFSFVTAPNGTSSDTTPPVRSNGLPSGVYASGSTNMTMSLSTNENATCKYGTSAGVAYASIANNFTATGGTSHSANLTGLTAGTKTYYVRCQDTVGNANTDDYIISFGIPPFISNGLPTGTLAVGATTATLSVTTDENATCKYGTTGSGAISFYASLPNTFTTTGGTSHSANLTGLTAGTKTYYVRCQDASGNSDTSDYAISFTIPAVADTTAPTVPGGLTATVISSSQINLSWTASTDATGVTGYKIYRGGTQIGTSATNSYSDNGLTASTAYSYTISAYDAAGNNSGQSATAFATTQAATTPTAGSHPRIFLTPSVLATLRAKAAANDPDWLSIKSKADAYAASVVDPYSTNSCSSGHICYPYEGFGWLDALQNLAMAYQVTGNTAYSAKVIQILNAANAATAAGDVTPFSQDSGYPSRSTVFGIALGYDWVYDQLSSAQKTATANSINAWYDWYVAHAYQADGSAGNNYWGGHILGFGVAGLATAPANPSSIQPGENSRAQEITNHVRAQFNAKMPIAFSSTGEYAGGYVPESYNYGPNHVIRLLEYMLAIKSATGEDLISSSNYAQLWAKNLLYNLKPNRWQATDEGDYPGSFSQIMPADFPLVLGAVLEGHVEGLWMQSMSSNMGVPPIPDYDLIPYQGPAPFESFLFANASRPSGDYRSGSNLQPTSFRSPGDEHVYTRSDWTDNATWASFAAGSMFFEGHQTRAAGHIAIQRGNDYLLVNSGQWKGTGNGLYGSPEAFTGNSCRTNTLYFNDNGEYMYPDQNYYCGGQGTYSQGNQILASELTNGYVYTKADLTNAYKVAADSINSRPYPQSLQNFTRSFVALGNKFVIFDRVKAAKSSYIKKLFWHFNPSVGAPTLSGNTVRSQAGSSAIFIKTLLPSTPTITIAQDPASGGDIYAPGPYVTYRSEVSDSVAGTNLTALHAIVTTDSGVAAMPNTTGITSATGNMVGSVVSDGSSQSVVMFSADGTSQSSVGYSASYTGSAKHLLTDIVPGTYDIYKDGSAASNRIFTGLSASLQGVLSFDSTSGSFSITQTGTTPVTPTTPTISSFTASPASITSGQSSSLAWSVSGATALTIDQSVGNVTGLTSKSVSPSLTTTYTLTATNSTGGLATKTVTVTVGSVTDITPPTVSLTAPANGAAISGTISVAASASDAGGIASVQFLLDGVNLGTPITISPYTLSWNTPTASNGSHSLIAVAKDAAGNPATSTPVIVSLNNDTTAPTLSLITSANLTTNSATITWSTDEPANSQVEYGLTSAYGSSSVLDSNLTASHSVNLSALTANTTYHFRVKSKDSSANLVVSSDQTFSTLADLVPNVFIISQVTSGNITTTGAAIKWQTSQPGTSQVEYGLTSAYGNSTALDSNLVTSHAVSLSSLNNKSFYHYRVKSRDSAGTEYSSPDMTFQTKVGKVRNLSASKGSIILNWDQPLDNYTGILILRSMTGFIQTPDKTFQIADITTNTYHDNNVTAGTTYYYTLFAHNDQDYSDPTFVSFVAGATADPTIQNNNNGNNPGSGNLLASNILVADHGTIYVIIGKTKLAFASMTAFRALGYALSNVVLGDTGGYTISSYLLNSGALAHPWGSWLKYGKTVYYNTSFGMVPVPTWDIFLSNGGQAKFILPMNKADINNWKSKGAQALMVENDPRVTK